MRACVVWQGNILAFGYSEVHCREFGGSLGAVALLACARRCARITPNASATVILEATSSVSDLIIAPDGNISFHRLTTPRISPSLSDQEKKRLKIQQSVASWRSPWRSRIMHPSAQMVSSDRHCQSLATAHAESTKMALGRSEERPWGCFAVAVMKIRVLC